MGTDTPPPEEPDWILPAEAGIPATPPEAAPPSGPTAGPRRAIAGALALVVAGAVVGATATHEVWRARAATTAATRGDGSALFPEQPNGFTAPGQPGDPFGGSGGNAGSDATRSGPADALSIARNVDADVVDINTTIGYANARAAGTGMVLTSTAEILTNNHVISGATSISVTDVGNGKTYNATVVGYDKTRDVAVLQLHGATGLATIEPASKPVQVGAGVVGVGNAGGTGGTPSYAGGVITAVGQTIRASDSSDGSSEQLAGLLETNANIMAGDSGGPLVNTQGQVVGMNTAASANYRFTAGSDAYAIPISDALDVARQIEAGQPSATVHVGPTAMLGVGVQPDASAVAGGALGAQSEGAVIVQVVGGGPAATAGISAGDTIVALDGQSVTSASDVSRIIMQQRPGATLQIGFLDRSGARHTAVARLVAGPPQ
jgi:S1-C subfamily serine protease